MAVLPLGHTGFGDSPYQPFSAFAGQPLIISLDHLKELHLLYDEDFRDMPAWNAEQINYGELIEFKTGLLKLAYSRFHDESLSDGIHDDPEMKRAYDNFCETSVWLEDYALFMARQGLSPGHALVHVGRQPEETNQEAEGNMGEEARYRDGVLQIYPVPVLL